MVAVPSRIARSLRFQPLGLPAPTIRLRTRINWNSSAVVSYKDKIEQRAFDRFGAFVRQTARQSIRKQPLEQRQGRDREGQFARVAERKRKPSPPGRPPGNVKGLLKDNIIFRTDKRRHSVVIGPVRLPRMEKTNLIMLEFGGTRTYRGQKQRYPARPFMRPAFNKELPHWRRILQDVAGGQRTTRKKAG